MRHARPFRPAIAPALALLALAGLSACDGGDKTKKDEGTSITVDASDKNATVSMGLDGNTGEASLNVPGFSGTITLPKVKLSAEDFDLNGVKLFPGSTITSMNFAAKDGDEAGKKDGSAGVRVAFESPAKPDEVKAWFLDKLTSKANYTLKANGSGLAGTTDGGDAFSLTLKPADGGKTSGVISITDTGGGEASE